MTVRKTELRFDTIAIQGGYDHSAALAHQGAICEPAYLSPAQHYDTSADMRESLLGRAAGWVYTRIDNPTVSQLESVISKLEGYGSSQAVSSTVFSSGMAAIFMAANALVAKDEMGTQPNIVISTGCYGGSYMLFTERFSRDRGIELRWVSNSLDLQEWERSIDQQTRFVFCEVPSNPHLRMTDIRALADIAHAVDTPLIVDATVASPALMRPLQMGADIVVQSVSKSMSASGLSLAGAVSSIHNIAGHFGRSEMREDFAGFLKRGPQRDIGAILSPFNALMSISDLRNLRTRTNLMSETAERLAKNLAGNPLVEEVFYPGLSSNPGYLIAQRDMILVDSEFSKDGIPENRYGYLLSLRPRGGQEAACAFLDALLIFWRANDLGRIKSTATIPAISTHSQLSQQEKNLVGIQGDLVRLSVGCEHADDLLHDVLQALERSQVVVRKAQ